jgi:AmmeMemoRadiSam system protein A
MSSDNHTDTTITDAEQQLLLQLARESIEYGLQHQHEIALSTDEHPPQLQEQRATFVTLHLNHQLRGCIGTLEAYQPLVLDVAHNAYAAAFNDPRFMPVTQNEANNLEIHISILNPAEELRFSSEQELIDQIRPAVDGLIMQDGGRKGTFLPSVWEQLAEPKEFVCHLKRKAGLPVDYWSDTLRVWRYTTTSFP